MSAHLKGIRAIAGDIADGRTSAVDVCRDAHLSPTVCIGCTRRLGLASVLHGVPAQQEMGRETIAGS